MKLKWIPLTLALLGIPGAMEQKTRLRSAITGRNLTY